MGRVGAGRGVVSPGRQRNAKDNAGGRKHFVAANRKAPPVIKKVGQWPITCSDYFGSVIVVVVVVSFSTGWACGVVVVVVVSVCFT